MINFRSYRPEDPGELNQLTALWTQVFGDPPALIETFYRTLPYMGSCCVAEEDGCILGMAHMLNGFTLLQPGQAPRVCGYLYAVAVSEKARCRGLGAELSRRAAAAGRKQGAELICTLPAEEGLYGWYGRILSLTHRCSRTVYTAPDLPKGCFRISTAEYSYYREDILFSTPHVELTNAAMEFQAQLFSAYGGGLYRSEQALFCALPEDNAWLFPELLSFAPAKDRTASPVFPSDALPDGFQALTRPYLASDLPFPDSFLWNLTLD